MMRLFTQNLIPAMLAMIIVMAAFPTFDSIGGFISRTRPAIEWHGVEVITKTVRPGDDLELVYSATINKQCPADLRGFLVDDDGTVPVRFPVVAGGYAKPTDGPVEIRVKFPIPPSSDKGLAALHDGEFIYRTLATRYCPDGVEEDSGVPDAKFRLDVP